MKRTLAAPCISLCLCLALLSAAPGARAGEEQQPDWKSLERSTRVMLVDLYLKGYARSAKAMKARHMDTLPQFDETPERRAFVLTQTLPVRENNMLLLRAKLPVFMDRAARYGTDQNCDMFSLLDMGVTCEYAAAGELRGYYRRTHKAVLEKYCK